ncbi:MAG: prolipoprotein diacylglyceryl transferase family protein [Ginsengibacter sp.]
MSLLGAATFFALAMLAKLLIGGETIVYYHHEIAILAICSIVLRLLHMQVLPYLDITIIGVATFLSFGRIGCFSVGCCHGKPAKGGVIYGYEHVKAGFTFYYKDIPLFPIQLIESLFVFLIVVVGFCLLLLHFVPGTFLILYTVGYGTFRFIIEFFRGDPERPYFKGLSEAQWTTLLLIGVSLWLGLEGYIPLYMWHIVLSFFLFIGAVIIVLKENAEKKAGNKIASPAHIRQIAMAISKSTITDQIKESQETPANVDIYETGLGLSISKGELMQKGVCIKHYTVSCESRQLTCEIADKLAKVIQQIQKHNSAYRVLEQDNQVFHIIFKE